ncbi:DUF427 domain-containing protein [Deinococcus sp. MIMF12]|uniref:DUF427 domain-containing protein n=1 Tax=Deinococcus rhizophilus TaxID=3049544 RepID=A0ABT7JEJ1_9DEIO|nr:DUF427 domain-containing protein [Deinococcus rhizophilus]MDL2343482.1 DUF427 domain-containing protein [Deinococcus rhizophilus]
MPRPQPIPPGPGQESVWDYPRPPRLERTSRRVEIWLGGVKIADTAAAYRVLETSHPPTYYLPPEAFLSGVLTPAPGGSVCEWKGEASYWTLSAGGRVAEAAGWSYERPTPAFREIAGHVAVYAGRMDECRVDGVRVTPQPGGFYGGWITPDVVGPFKGEPGTWGW